MNNRVLELFFQYIHKFTSRTLRPSEVEPGSDAAPADDGASRTAGGSSRTGDRTIPSLCDNNHEELGLA